MKIQGNQGMQQTINWVKESIDAQLNKPKDIGNQFIERVQNAFEQRLGGDRFARSQHSGVEAAGLDDMAQRASSDRKSRRRGKLRSGLKPPAEEISKKPDVPDVKDKPHIKYAEAKGEYIKRPDIIQVPDTGTTGGSTGTKPTFGRYTAS